MSDREHDARIWSEIYQVDREIQKYQNAKSSVQSVKRTLDSQKENWQQTYNRLGKRAELANVEKKDVFEGEMAQKLKSSYVSVEMTNLEAGLSGADALKISLSNQISRIERRIQQLKEKRRQLYSQL